MSKDFYCAQHGKNGLQNPVPQHDCTCPSTHKPLTKPVAIAHCGRCGEPIYDAELFKGPVCHKCGHWC